MIARLLAVSAAATAALLPSSAQAAPGKCVGYPPYGGSPYVAACVLTDSCVVAAGGTIFADSYCVPQQPTRCVGYPASRPVAGACVMTTDCYVAAGGTIFADRYCVPR